MIKLKKLLKEHAWDRNFGEPLPTLKDVAEKHAVEEESVTENIKVVPSNKIDSKVWRKMKYDLRDQFDELVKIGQDYGVFQNAQGTNKILKQIKKLMDKI
jgi:hypothetical protein